MLEERRHKMAEAREFKNGVIHIKFDRLDLDIIRDTGTPAQHLLDDALWWKDMYPIGCEYNYYDETPNYTYYNVRTEHVYQFNVNYVCRLLLTGKTVRIEPKPLPHNDYLVEMIEEWYNET